MGARNLSFQACSSRPVPVAMPAAAVSPVGCCVPGWLLCPRLAARTPCLRCRPGPPATRRALNTLPPRGMTCNTAGLRTAAAYVLELPGHSESGTTA